MAGIKLDFLADVGDLLRGTRDARESIDEISKSLDDVAEGGGEAAQKLERELTGSLDKVEKEAKQTGDAIGSSTQGGLDQATEHVEEFSDNAKSSLGDVATTFSGDMEDAASTVQNALGGLASGMGGPIGIALGAAAIGVGLIYKGLQDSAEEANTLKERVTELAAEIYEAGGNLEGVDLVGKMRDWGLAINDSKEWWELWQQDAVTNLERVSEKAEKFGLDLETTFRGMSGADTAAATESWQAITDKINESLEALEAYRKSGSATAAGVTDMSSDIIELQNLRTELERTSGVTEDAVRLHGLLEQAIGVTSAEAERAKRAHEGYNDAIEKSANPITAYKEILKEKEAAEKLAAQAQADATEDMKDTWQDYVKGVDVSIDDLIERLRDQSAAREEFDKNLTEIAAAGGQALADELRAKGPEVAAATADVLAEADPAKLRTYITEHARATGESLSAEIAQGVTDSKEQVTTALRDLFADQQVEIPMGIKAPEAPVAPQGAPAAQGLARPEAGPVVVHLSAEDRELLRNLAETPVAVTAVLEMDGRHITSVVNQARRRANTAGRWSL